jgi:hypothetical protein
VEAWWGDSARSATPPPVAQPCATRFLCEHRTRTRRVAELVRVGTDGPKILVVGVDVSFTSLRAGAYATGLARRQHVRLVIVYVANPGGLIEIAADGAAAARQLTSEIANDLHRRIDKLAPSLGIFHTFRVESGDAFSHLVARSHVGADRVIRAKTLGHQPARPLGPPLPGTRAPAPPVALNVAPCPRQ